MSESKILAVSTIRTSSGKHTIDYRHAVPDDALHMANLYNSVYQGGYPIKDCLDPDRIKDLLISGEHIWMLAFDENRVIGAAVSRPERWNRSYETCRSVTDHAQYQSNGIGKKLYELVLNASLLRKDCDVVYGFPRSPAMRSVVEKTDPSAIIVGTDFGMHLVSGEREVHLWDMLFNPYSKTGRIMTPNPLLARNQQLQDYMLKVKGGNMGGISYPQKKIVGPFHKDVYESRHGRVYYNYFEPSRHADVVNVEAKNDESTVRALWDFAINSPDKLEHLSFFLLADKMKFLSLLCTPLDGNPLMRFHVSAYLPGWHHDKGYRFDCLHVAARPDPKPPKSRGLDDVVAQLHSEFSL